MGYKKNLIRLLFAVMVTTSFLLAGCQTDSGQGKKTATKQAVKYGNSGNLIGIDGGFAAGLNQDDPKAIAIYRATVTEFPDAPESAIAWFKLGKHYLNLRKYRAALEHFNKVVNSFPDSKFASGAAINRGVCLVYLKQHEEADKQLRSSFVKATPEMQGSLLYYLGENSYLSNDYMRALIRYAKTNDAAGVFATSAKRRINMIVHSYLSEGQLLEVSNSYKNRFPADIALLELSRIYGRSGDTRSMEMVDRKLARFFPELQPKEQEGNEPVISRSSGITIGCVLPLSGEDAAVGAEALRGIQLLFSLNKHLVDRYSIGLLIKDSGSSSRLAAEGVSELAKDGSVVAIIGPFSGGTAEQSLKVANRYHLPLLTPLDGGTSSSSIFGGGSSYLFPIGITDKRSAEVMASVAVEQHGFKTIAAIYPDTEKGSQLITSFQTGAKKFDGELVSFQPYYPEATDFGEQIKALGGRRDSTIRNLIWKRVQQNSKATPEDINNILAEEFIAALTVPYISKYRELPLSKDNFSIGLSTSYDAIYVPALEDNSGLILPELAFYNLGKTTLLGSVGYVSENFLRMAGKYLEGAIFPAEFHPSLQQYAIVKFTDNYRQAFGKEPKLASARAFDALSITLSAIADGAVSKKLVAKTLSNLPTYIGVSGEYAGQYGAGMVKTPFLLTMEKGRLVEYHWMPAVGEVQ